MKNRIFALILSGLMLTLSACATEETQENSDFSADSSIIADEQSDETQNSESDEVSAYSSENKSIQIISAGGTYEFGEDGTGSYSVEFDAVEYDERGIALTLTDGRNMNLNYSEVVYDETDKIYKTEINDITFWIEESYTQESNNFYQVFQCIEPIDKFKGKVISTIIITYYPELEHGRINMTFLYETQGDEYTIYYPDGGIVTRRISFDEEKGEYYFAE